MPADVELANHPKHRESHKVVASPRQARGMAVEFVLSLVT